MAELLNTKGPFGGNVLKNPARCIFNVYSTILTEPEVNNCFDMYTRSDLSRIGKETIKKKFSSINGRIHA